MNSVRDQLESLAERGTPTEPSVFVERVRLGLSQPQARAGRKTQSPVRIAVVASVVVVLVALSAVWLVGREGSDNAASSRANWVVLFCRSVTTAVPEGFVGSDKHIAQFDRLIDGAPSAIAPDLQTVRAYIDEHVSPSRPASNLISRWPEKVQTANRGIMRYAERRCGLSEDASGSLSATFLPPGFIEVAGRPTNPAPGLTVVHSYVKGSEENPTGSITVTTWSPPRQGDLDTAGAVKVVSVRGKEAVVRNAEPLDLGFITVAWAETPNLEVVVAGSGLTESDLLAVAEGLQ